MNAIPDPLEAVTILVSAASTASDPGLRILYRATARTALERVKARARELEHLTEAMEREAVRTAGQVEPGGLTK